MARLPLTPLLKYALEENVTILRDAYSAACSTIPMRTREIEERLRSTLGLGPEEEFPEDDTDDLMSLYDDASYQSDLIRRSGPLLRVAFAIALFHLWERHCNGVLGNKGDYKTSAPRELDVRPQYAAVKSTLYELEDVANCAKHGPGRASKSLFDNHSHLFPGVTNRQAASHRNLKLEDSDLYRYFAAVEEGARSDFETNAVA